MRYSVKQNLQKGRAFTQVTLDDDCIVKDNKPDVNKIIHTRGSISFEEVKVSGQTVWVTGQLTFTVLYRSDENKLESFSDSINFGEKIYMDEVEELDTVKLSGRLEDLNISAINSRKLAVRAVLEMKAVCEQMAEEELVSGIRADESIEQRQDTRQLLLLVTSKRDILRTHNEFTLPGASPNIGRIIYSNVDIRNKEIVLSNDRVQLQGEAHISVLYSSQEGQMEWYESMVPFTGVMDCEMGGQKPLCWISSRPADTELEVISDTDGEMRSLSLDMTFDVDIKVWSEEEVQVLSDVYSLSRNLIPQTAKMCGWKLLVKNEAKLRISQPMKLTEEQERILQLCTYEGNVTVDQIEIIDHGLRVEGILSVHILYATTDDSFPLAHTFEQIPFSQIIDVQGLNRDTEGVSYELEPAIDQLSVNLLDNERYEIKASISLDALVLQEECFDKIVEIVEEPLDAQTLADRPGVVGYLVQERESLWDIAKRFHTTEAEIVSTNGLKSPEVRLGEKLIIVKNIG
jgi:LysM repeat protein